jgi:hypothetical protein
LARSRDSRIGPEELLGVLDARLRRVKSELLAHLVRRYPLFEDADAEGEEHHQGQQDQYQHAGKCRHHAGLPTRPRLTRSNRNFHVPALPCALLTGSRIRTRR